MSDDKKIHRPMHGVQFWVNPKNKFGVIQIHYSADPAKRDPAWADGIRSSMPRRDWEREYEMRWETWEGLPVYADFSEEFHGVDDAIHPHLGLPLLRGWDFGLCYSDDTELLTEVGWKLFKDLTDEDRVATANPETWQIEYVRPARRFEFDYQGEMLEWKSQNLNLCVTPEHIIPHTRRESPNVTRWSSAETLSKEMTAHRFVRVAAQWTGELFVKNPLGWDQLTFARVMGMYLSEGSAGGRRISIYQRDDRAEWAQALAATGLKWIRVKDGKAAGWRLNSTAVTPYFASFGRACEKRIPREILSGTRPVLEEFLRFYTEGDGHIRTRANGSEEHTCFTISKGLADDLQELAAKLGWSSSVRRVKPARSLKKDEGRYIQNTGGWRVHFKKGIWRTELFQEHFRRVPYNGKIYCVTVPHHTLFVRRDGIPSWNGNTPAAVICQLQEGTLCAIYEFVAFNMGIERFSEIVLQKCQVLFPAWSDKQRDWLDFIDPAGFARKDTDESTCAKVLMGPGRNLRVQGGAIAWEERRKSVEHYLTHRYNNGPAFKVSLPNCPMLVNGFKGGYHYPKEAGTIEPQKLRPVKNKYSHIHDAYQMVASKLRPMQRRPRAAPPPNPSYGFTRDRNR